MARSGEALAKTRRWRDPAATRALILGILSLPFGVFSPFAIWTGARALRRINASNGALGGRGSAALGLIAGSIGLVTLVVGTAYWFNAS